MRSCFSKNTVPLGLSVVRRSQALCVKNMMITKIKNYIVDNMSEGAYRGLTFALSMFVLMPSITILMFAVYMSEHDFFSYDFFVDGIFGMKLFFITTILLLTITSFGVFGFVLIIFSKLKKKPIDKFSATAIVIINLLMDLIIFIGLSNGAEYERMIFVFILSLAIIIHISILLYCSAQAGLISLCTICLIALLICINSPKQASNILGMGLKSFCAGGGIPIEISHSESHIIKKGKLKLITPRNIYFTPENKKGVAVFPISNLNYFYIGNDIN